jgi:hypothetical protein
MVAALERTERAIQTKACRSRGEQANRQTGTTSLYVLASPDAVEDGA